jgi:hypothetical protein
VVHSVVSQSHLLGHFPHGYLQLKELDQIQPLRSR